MTSMHGLLLWWPLKIYFQTLYLMSLGPALLFSHFVVLFEDGTTSMTCKSSPLVHVFFPFSQLSCLSLFLVKNHSNTHRENNERKVFMKWHDVRRMFLADRDDLSCREDVDKWFTCSIYEFSVCAEHNYYSDINNSYTEFVFGSDRREGGRKGMIKLIPTSFMSRTGKMLRSYACVQNINLSHA